MRPIGFLKNEICSPGTNIISFQVPVLWVLTGDTAFIQGAKEQRVPESLPLHL